MKTLETQVYTGKEKGQIKENTILNTDVSEQLSKIFGLEKGDISYSTNDGINNLSDSMEVNSTEMELARLFGKQDQFTQLNYA